MCVLSGGALRGGRASTSRREPRVRARAPFGVGHQKHRLPLLSVNWREAGSTFETNLFALTFQNFPVSKIQNDPSSQQNNPPHKHRATQEASPSPLERLHSSPSPPPSLAERSTARVVHTRPQTKQFCEKNIKSQTKSPKDVELRPLRNRKQSNPGRRFQWPRHRRGRGGGREGVFVHLKYSTHSSLLSFNLHPRRCKIKQCGTFQFLDKPKKR